MPTIAELVARGRLEELTPDRAEARDLLAHATAHVSSATAIVEHDPAGAYQLAYDAARKAVAADMLANGYRVKADRPGAHASVVAYARQALVDDADADALARLDGMRRLRNRSEYGAITPSRAQIDADLRHASEVVRAVADRLQRAR